MKKFLRVCLLLLVFQITGFVCMAFDEQEDRVVGEPLGNLGALGNALSDIELDVDGFSTLYKYDGQGFRDIIHEELNRAREKIIIVVDQFTDYETVECLGDISTRKDGSVRPIILTGSNREGEGNGRAGIIAERKLSEFSDCFKIPEGHGGRMHNKFIIVDDVLITGSPNIPIQPEVVCFSF